MADSSFDIVSKIDHQEVDNALNQAAKEINQRYDFKNVGASIEWSGEAIDDEGELRGTGQGGARRLPGEAHQARHLLKALEAGDPKASGKEYDPHGDAAGRASRRRMPRSSARSSVTKAPRA